MKKNGFVFVETIISIVILTSSLLLLYTSFSKILQSEKTRVYYDDVSYIYRTEYLKNKINDLNINTLIRHLESDDHIYFLTIGMDTEDLFLNYEEKAEFMNQLVENFEVKQMILLKANKIDNLKKCSIKCSENQDCQEYENCNDLYLKLSDEFINYLKTIYVETNTPYILGVEYETCNLDNQNCQEYYSWVSV